MQLPRTILALGENRLGDPEVRMLTCQDVNSVGLFSQRVLPECFLHGGPRLFARGALSARSASGCPVVSIPQRSRTNIPRK